MLYTKNSKTHEIEKFRMFDNIMSRSPTDTIPRMANWPPLGLETANSPGKDGGNR